MVKVTIGGASTTATTHFEAYCLRPQNVTTLPKLLNDHKSGFVDVQNIKISINERDKFEAHIPVDTCTYIEYGDESVIAGFEFDNASAICTKGGPKVLNCVLGASEISLECSDPSVLAIRVTDEISDGNIDASIEARFNSFDTQYVSLDLLGCSPSFAFVPLREQVKSICASGVYHMYTTPSLSSMGYGLFVDEPCGTRTSEDCVMGADIDDSLDYCSYEEEGPTTAPTTHSASPTIPSGDLGTAKTYEHDEEESSNWFFLFIVVVFIIMMMVTCSSSDVRKNWGYCDLSGCAGDCGSCDINCDFSCA